MPDSRLDSRLVCREGKVIGEEDGKFRVKILSHSACADCHAKGICSALELQEKIIDAVPANMAPIRIGDTVQVFMEEKLGLMAVFYGFVLPLVVLMSVLFIAYILTANETRSALLGLGSLVPYYFLLYLFRGKVEKEFVFRIEKLNE